MIRVYVVIKEITKLQIFIAYGQVRLCKTAFSVVRYSSIGATGIPQHTETYQRNLFCFEHESEVKQII